MRTAAATVPIAVVMLLAGCTGEATTGEPKSVDGIAVDVRDGGAGGPDAGLEGALIMEDGCFYLEAEGLTWVLSFSRGDVERDGDGITFDGTTYLPGDEINARGQEFTPENLEAPTTCRTDRVWMVFSEDA